MWLFRQKFVAVLLIVLTLNTFSWSVGAAALTDWVQSEQVVASTAVDATDPNGDHEIVGIDTHCNAGCHASAHLQAAIFPPHLFLLEPAAQFVPMANDIAEADSASSLYRPPRPAVLAGL
jgi:hypothetical protein